MQYQCINKEDWDKTIEHLLLSYTIFASIENDFSIDYELIQPGNIEKIIYNKPKPVTPLKSFFLPVKENVTSARIDEKPRIIMGIPNCDIEGISLLDDMYLDEEFCDIFYSDRRKNTLLISSDCFGIQEHCHCLAYNIKPYSEKIADLAVIYLDGKIILKVLSENGEDFIKKIPSVFLPADENLESLIGKEHLAAESLLNKRNIGLPDYKKTGELIKNSGNAIWEKYSASCVSCGACATICPTCTCFLLIDKPDFGKIKQLDACQYPGFERVAGGDDALFELHNRFRNRYMCKYVWKPERFDSIACTGCGRCIDGCIGKISKNEIFMELIK
jgi:sulfhydrogenase subunit beta (sulfur reductase)